MVFIEGIYHIEIKSLPIFQLAYVQQPKAHLFNFEDIIGSLPQLCSARVPKITDIEWFTL